MRRPGRCLVVCAALAIAGVPAACIPPQPTAARDAAPPGPAPVGGGYLALGTRLLAANEPERAYRAFMMSIAVEGLSAEALTGAGIAAEKQGLLVSARRYLEGARALDPNSIVANNNLGVVLFMLKEYYPARDAFRAAYALSSGRSEIAERNLNRAEAVVAQIEEAERTDAAVSHRVVRLGTSEFRITRAAPERAEMMAAE